MALTALDCSTMGDLAPMLSEREVRGPILLAASPKLIRKEECYELAHRRIWPHAN